MLKPDVERETPNMSRDWMLSDSRLHLLLFHLWHATNEIAANLTADLQPQWAPQTARVKMFQVTERLDHVKRAEVWSWQWRRFFNSHLRFFISEIHERPQAEEQLQVWTRWNRSSSPAAGTGPVFQTPGFEFGSRLFHRVFCQGHERLTDSWPLPHTSELSRTFLYLNAPDSNDAFTDRVRLTDTVWGHRGAFVDV